MASLKTRFDAALEKYGELIRDAFLEGVAEIKSRVVLKIVVERLEKGDLDGAVEALHIERPAFASLESALAIAYQGGGTMAVKDLPFLSDPAGARVVVRFDARNPQAEAWLRDRSSGLVTSIVADQKVAIRAALEQGMAAGQNPNTTALNVVGRINRATGAREGGIVGLTEQQAGFVATSRAELASGDPAQLQNYLGRSRRDKRFDATVQAAVKSGKPLPQETIARIAGRYSDRLLQLRGETIARTESLASLNASAHEAFRQGLGKTNYTEDMVVREWDSVGDDRVRETHMLLNGQKVRGLETPFHSPSGAMLRYPGDTALGAGAAETINCRCRQKIKIDYFGEHR